MATLPTPGGDTDTWGDELNTYLLVAHAADGTLRDVLSGTGSPEGAVTGSIGQLFRRTNGSTGTTLYIKESGAGNTGWVAVAAGAGGSVATDAIYDAKGDLPVGTGANTAAKLVAGANGTVPTYASAETTGLLPKFPPGYQYGRKELTTTDTTTTQTVQASAATLITMDAITFDGSEVMFEFEALVATHAGTVVFHLWEDSTDKCYIGYTNVASSIHSITGKVFYSPAAGSKVMSLRWYIINAGTAHVYGGSGTGGNHKPVFLRAVRA